MPRDVRPRDHIRRRDDEQQAQATKLLRTAEGRINRIRPSSFAVVTEGGRYGPTLADPVTPFEDPVCESAIVT